VWMGIDRRKAIGIGLHGLRRLSYISPWRVGVAWVGRILFPCHVSCAVVAIAVELQQGQLTG
jgi:hypothetical protein